MTEKELKNITIKNPSEVWSQRVKAHWDAIAKPLDGLGLWEEILVRIGSILEIDDFKDGIPGEVVIFCADNGIVEEGISQSGQEVTAMVAENMGKRISSVCLMAAAAGLSVVPVDVGIATAETPVGVLAKKIAYGTKNFHKEPAMTLQQVLQAITVGMEMVQASKARGKRILALGEMGIGNTTTSAAISAALLKLSGKQVAGKGAGLSVEGICRKAQMIDNAVEDYHLMTADVLDVLRTVGGFDIAAMVGVCIGGAYYHVPIVLDGVISEAAALVATRLHPGVTDYLIASHVGKEPAAKLMLEALGLQAILHGEFALGEGTGAVLLLSMLPSVLAVYQGNSTFEKMQLDPYRRK